MSDARSTDDQLFRELYPSLRRFAAVVRPSEVDGDDLVQEALMRALSIGPLRDLDDPGAYLRTAIVRIASNHRRRLGRARRSGELAAASSDAAALAVYPSDLADLQRLKPADRAILYLLVVERRSHRDVAALVGASETAVRSRASRALHRLRTELRATDE